MSNSPPLRILMVEDNPADAELIQAHLHHAGFQFEAIRVATEEDYCAQLGNAFDLILADFNLPQFTALVALELLQKQQRTIPFIVVTGTLSEDAAVECMKRGADDYLIKDRLARLGQAITHALQDHQIREEKRRSDIALRESETRFRGLAENASDIIYRYRVYPDWGFEYINPAVTVVNGYRPEEFYADPSLILRLIHPDDLTMLGGRNPDQNLRKPYIVRTLDQHGNTLWTEHRSIPIYDETGRMIALEGIARDVTSHKRYEEELETIVGLTKLVRNFSRQWDVIVAVCEELLKCFKVDAAALMLKEAQCDAISMRCLSGDWEQYDRAYWAADGAIGEQVMVSGQPHIVHENGGIVCLPLVTADQIIGALGIYRKSDVSEDDVRLLTVIGDIVANAIYRIRVMETLETRITERTAALQAINLELAAANERLQELDLLKSKFVSDVTHELRTPITTLGAYIYLLEHERPEKYPEHIAILKDQVRRLRSLVEGILDVSRLELGQSRIVVAPVNLNGIAEQVIAAHLPRLTAAGLTLRFDPASDLPPILGEANQLSQAVTNLLANAINYTASGGIRIATSADMLHQCVCLVVQDTGIGIDPIDLPHLFERFYRGQQVSQLTIPGTGLGLGIVKEIVDLHGGTIQVESELGKGSSFRLYLPLQNFNAQDCPADG